MKLIAVCILITLAVTVRGTDEAVKKVLEACRAKLGATQDDVDKAVAFVVPENKVRFGTLLSIKERSQRHISIDFLFSDKPADKKEPNS